nr:MAG TPA: putative tail fiber protein [Caudoviricetes sp.]
MNDCTTLGIYTGRDLKNAPMSGYVVWLNVSQDFNGGFVHQLCFVINYDSLFFRHSNNGVWSTWRQI